MNETFREFFKRKHGFEFPTYGGETTEVVQKRIAQATADWMDEIATLRDELETEIESVQEALDEVDRAHLREVALTLSLKTGKVNESNEEIVARATAFLAFLDPVTPK